MRGWVAFIVVFSIGSAFAQLNPTVKVLPKPQTSVPPECEEGLAPAVPRVIIAEAAPEEKKAMAPPSLDLKTRLRAVQIAAEANDRDAFKAALADARSAVNSYPPGGERSAATDVLNVDNDLERLWDYQLSSPVGAFFDSSTDFVAMMRRYSNYQASIADQTLTVNGQTIYPTEETRKFLIAEAARRLDRLGVRTPTRIVEAPPAPVPQPRVTPSPAPVPRHVSPQPQPQPRVAVKKPPKTTKRAVKTSPKVAPSHHAEHAKKPKPTTIAEAKTSPAMPRHVAPQPQPQPEPVPTHQPAPASRPEPAPTRQPAPTSQPAPAPQPAPMPAPTPAPQPATTIAQPAPPTTTTAQPAPQPQPQPTATTATTATAATNTTAPENAPAPSSGRMNLLFAVILIIVGIGVLIILFRASD